MSDLLIDREEAADLLNECQDLWPLMQERGVFGKRGSTQVPPKTLTCGELIRMTRGIMLLACQLYPELADPDKLEAIYTQRVVREAGGTVN